MMSSFVDTLKDCIRRIRRMEDNAQTLRIQQFQGTVNWEKKYHDIANSAWMEFNHHSESIQAELAKLIAQRDGHADSEDPQTGDSL